MKKEIEIKHQVRLTIGCVLLVASGMAFGVFQSMKYFLELDESSIWIPILGVICLIVGTSFICWGSATEKPSQTNDSGKGGK